MSVNQVTTSEVGMLVMTGENARDFSFLVDGHIEAEIRSCQFGNADPVFVKGVPLEDSVRDHGVIDHLVRVHEFHGLKA
jgi:hypothetical protein